MPTGFLRSAEGEFSYVFLDDPNADEDNEFDIEGAVTAVRLRVGKMIAEQDLRVAGVATNELCRFSDSPQEKTAVKITICHRDGPALTIYYPSKR